MFNGPDYYARAAQTHRSQAGMHAIQAAACHGRCSCKGATRLLRFLRLSLRMGVAPEWILGKSSTAVDGVALRAPLNHKGGLS